MKKPKTRVGDWYPADKSTDKGITSFTVDGLNPWDVQEAYEEMIDALIEIKEQIQDKEYHRSVFSDNAIKIINEVLKKAGCHE